MAALDLILQKSTNPPVLPYDLPVLVVVFSYGFDLVVHVPKQQGNENVMAHRSCGLRLWKQELHPLKKKKRILIFKNENYRSIQQLSFLTVDSRLEEEIISRTVYLINKR